MELPGRKRASFLQKRGACYKLRHPIYLPVLLLSLPWYIQVSFFLNRHTLRQTIRYLPSKQLEKHDFNFTDWTFEVKGTRERNLTHTINGIDQLKPSDNKRLGLISFLVSITDNANSIDLPSLIGTISISILSTRPDLIIRLNDLLAIAGYSPIFANEYKGFRIEILESTLFEVDNSFPHFTSDQLKSPLNNRITSIRYDISLVGLAGKKFSELN